MSRRFDHRDESGVVIILVALAMTSLLIIAAIVIDLGYVRGTRPSRPVDRRSGRARGRRGPGERATGRRVRGDGGLPQPQRQGHARPRCWRLLRRHGQHGVHRRSPRPGGRDDDLGQVHDHDRVPGAGRARCLPRDGRRRGGWTAVRSDAPHGGLPRARLLRRRGRRERVQVARSATLRAGPGETAKAPALWLLEPYGCNALATGGAGTSIVVGDMAAVPPIEGLVTVDSNGTQSNGTGGCSGGATTVDVSQGQIHALPTSVPTGSDQELGRDPARGHGPLGAELRDPGLRPGRRPERSAGAHAHPRAAARHPGPGRSPLELQDRLPRLRRRHAGIPGHRHPGLRDGRGGPALHRPAPRPGGHVRRSSGVRHLPEARCAVRQVQRRRCGGAARPATGSSTARTCRSAAAPRSPSRAATS